MVTTATKSKTIIIGTAMLKVACMSIVAVAIHTINVEINFVILSFI